MTKPTAKKPKLKRRRSASPEWREFEKLVARIEKAAGPRDAVVKSPDRVVDHVTGRKREVDASVRVKIGTAPILITLECRKRQPTQDVTWIEQLATKRQHVCAAKTIAVSSSGFSDGAVAAAKASGVELRRLDEVTRADIDSWLAPQFMLHIFRQSKLKTVNISYHQEPGDTLSPILAPEADARRREQGPNAKLFTVANSETTLSLNNMWLWAQHQQDFYANVPIDGTCVTQVISFQPPKGELKLPLTDGLRDVKEIKLTFDLWLEQEEVPFDQATFHTYSDMEGQTVQRAEFKTTIRNIEFSLGLIRPIGHSGGS